MATPITGGTPVQSEGEDGPEPPPPPAVKRRAPASIPETITAGKSLRILKSSMPKRQSKPPPGPAQPRGLVPTDRDVPMTRRARRAQARCLRRHNIVLSDRMEKLSRPTRRQLIYLWRTYANTLTAEQIYNLQNMLDASDPFKPDQAYEFFLNVKREKRREKEKASGKDAKSGKKELSALCGDRRFAWARSATVAFARGIQRRLARPAEYKLVDGMLRLSNIVLAEICSYTKVKPPCRHSTNPKAKFMLEMADKIAVWIDEILSESDDRMLMMDFDEDEVVKHADEPVTDYADDFLNMMAGKGTRLMPPKPAYLKFTGEMLEAFLALTNAMYQKGNVNLLKHGLFSQSYKEGADDLKQAPDLDAVDYDTNVQNEVSKKMTDLTKPIAVGKLEKPMKDMIEICSKYLAQEAEYNKDKGEAFKFLLKKMRQQPEEILCSKGRIMKTMGKAAQDLDEAKGLASDHDDPNMSQQIYSALENITRDTPPELQKDMQKTLDLCSKYLAQKTGDDNERGPAFDKMIELLERHGGKPFSSEIPNLATNFDVAHVLKNAPGFTSIKADPVTSPKYNGALHNALDATTPADFKSEMPEVINRAADYLSGYARDREKAQAILVKMMNDNPGKEIAKRNEKPFLYGEGVKEIDRNPVMTPLLPVKDITTEGAGHLTKDVATLTSPELKGAMKGLTKDAGGNFSQDVALITGAGGERYPRNLLAAALATKGDDRLFKSGPYQMTSKEASDALKKAGQFESLSDPKAVALQQQIAAGLTETLNDRLPAQTAARLTPTVQGAAGHLAKIGVEKGEELQYLLDVMMEKKDQPLTKIQGIPHSYEDAARKVATAPTLANDQVDKGTYETVRSKLKEVVNEKPESKGKSLAGIIDDVSKYLAKPAPETEEERKELLATLLANKDMEKALQQQLKGGYEPPTGSADWRGVGGVRSGGVGAGGVSAGVGAGGAGTGGLTAGGAGTGGVTAGGVGAGVGAGGAGTGGVTAGGVGAGVGAGGAGTGGVGAGVGAGGAGTGGVTAGGVGAGVGAGGAGTGGVGAGVGAGGAGTGGVGAGVGAGGASAGGVGAGGAGASGISTGGIGAGGVGASGVGTGGAGAGGVGASGVGAGGVGAGSVGAGVGAGGVGAGVGAGGVGAGGVGAGVGAGGAGASGVGAGGAGAGGYGTGGVKPGGVGADSFGAGGVGASGAGGFGTGGVGAGGVGTGGVGAGGVGTGGYGAGAVGAGGVGAGGYGADGIGTGGVGAGGVGAGGVGAGGVGAGGVGAGGVGAGGVGAGGVGAGGVGAGGVGAGGIGAGGIGAGRAGAAGYGKETEEQRRARRLSELRRRIASGERGDDDPEYNTARKHLIQQLRRKGNENFHKQAGIEFTNGQAADILEKQPIEVDRSIRESADTDKLARKFERKLSASVEGNTPPALRDAMSDVVVESARYLGENFISKTYKSTVKDALIDSMQRRDSEIIADKDGETETFFYAAQRLKKYKVGEAHSPHPKTARELAKKLEECVKSRPMARKVGAVMKDHVNETADYLSGNVMMSDPEIDALIDLLNQMENAGDQELVGGKIPKSHKDAAAYLKSLTSYEDKINKPDKKLQNSIEGEMKSLMSGVPMVGYNNDIRNKAIAQQAGLLTSYLKNQGEKTDCLEALVEHMETTPNEMLLRHGTARKTYFDATEQLHGKNADQLKDVENPDPVVGRKLQLKLNSIVEGTPLAEKPLMSEVIDDVTDYLAVHFLHPQVLRVCKCMKSVFVQCELWCEEILRRVTRPCCTCSQHRVTRRETTSFPGFQIDFKECPTLASRTRDGPKLLCPGNKPAGPCAAVSHTLYATVHNRPNLYSARSLSPSRLRPHSSYLPHTQRSRQAMAYPESIGIGWPDETKAGTTQLHWQSSSSIGPTASTSATSPDSYQTMTDSQQSLKDHHRWFHQSPMTMYAAVQRKLPSHITRQPVKETRPRPYRDQWPADRGPRSDEIAERSNSPIVTTDQMSDLYAMLVSLMWNVQAWRDWLQENLDRAVAPHTAGDTVHPDQEYTAWVSFQKRVMTEALQWRQYNIFSRQLTMRLELRYKDKQIVSPTRATVKTQAYSDCQREMLEIIDMFNKWTHWLMAVLKETETLEVDPFDEVPLYVACWNHFKKKVESSMQDWIRYNAHLNICWKQKYRNIMTAWKQEGPVWVMSACGAVPSGAVAAGKYYGEVTWVARTTHNSEVLPAALVPSKHCCLVYADGGVHCYTKYQVLCNAEVQWVAWRGGRGCRSLEARAVAVAAGVRAGRVRLGAHHLLGAVPAPHHRCHVVINNTAYAFKCFQLLVMANENPTRSSSPPRF